MRKYQQKQLLELIQTLNEANAEIGRLFLSGDLSNVIRLLADCQDFVVQIGNFIESIEGEGTETVALLEEYHNYLYDRSVEICEGTATPSLIKHLRKKVITVENSIKRELKPNKIEVIFLPYKASMWDSLESIWLAAKDDSQCDAYVVPIPYYDKLPNGALGQMHYEGGAYPDYVPVVDWQEYDIEARHPDVAFIHNPYDDGNLVTSMHPNFYSSRLRDLTDLLCYVPYFVAMNDVKEHFCTTSACLHAHKIFVQSKKVRDTYSRVFKITFGGTREKTEEKFIALGSPKFDKAINSRSEDFRLSERWSNILRLSGYDKKKIVIYNTSITGLLQDNARYIDKISSVIDFFLHREGVVLWWRPHPLNAATYSAMRPQLLEKYENLLSYYKREENGIFDDTPDLNRAIAYADAYYGDWSSVATLFAATGKMTMINNVSVLAENISPLKICDISKLWNENGRPVLMEKDSMSLCKMIQALVDEEYEATRVELATEQNNRMKALHGDLDIDAGEKIYNYSKGMVMKT